MYKSWLHRVAKVEFADELLVAAAALELGLKIVCVPFTPAGQELWKISEYNAAASTASPHRVVYLGNNDVHYMWLA